MFVRPEQVADFVARHADVARARVTVTREGEMDAMRLSVESAGADPEALAASAAEVLKRRAEGEVVAPRTLPNDGKVIDDQRSYE